MEGLISVNLEDLIHRKKVLYVSLLKLKYENERIRRIRKILGNFKHTRLPTSKN